MAILRTETVKRHVVDADPTSALPTVALPGDVVLHGTTSYVVTDAGLVAATAMDQTPNFTSVSIGGVPGAATASHKFTKAVTAFTDNTAKAILTVTVPNATHAAMVRVTILGQLGAGGSVGAGEAYGTISYDFIVGRFAGAATTMVASTAYGSAVSLAAGAATIAIVGAIGSLTGANTVEQTYTITGKITKGSGASDAHTAVVLVEVLNAAATGITVA